MEVQFEYYADDHHTTRSFRETIEPGVRACQVFVQGRYYGTAVERAGLFAQAHTTPLVWMNKEKLICNFAMNNIQAHATQLALLSREHLISSIAVESIKCLNEMIRVEQAVIDALFASTH
jgi:hypothetical protein